MAEDIQPERMDRFLKEHIQTCAERLYREAGDFNEIMPECTCIRNPAGRYIKNLEDMLRRIVKDVETWTNTQRLVCCELSEISSDHIPSCIVTEAKALLESTGYTDDF